jgi:quaternary ammonium compound-resistance protein SugE
VKLVTTSYQGPAAQEDDLPHSGNRPGRPDLKKVKVMSWIYLISAGLLEVVWAYFMKQSEGFTRLTPTIITIVAMIASFGLLALAMRTLPLSTAYMVWTGIGAIGAFIVGAVLLGEPVNAMRIVAALLITSGLLIMKFF